MVLVAQVRVVVILIAVAVVKVVMEAGAGGHLAVHSSHHQAIRAETPRQSSNIVKN